MFQGHASFFLCHFFCVFFFVSFFLCHFFCVFFFVSFFFCLFIEGFSLKLQVGMWWLLFGVMYAVYAVYAVYACVFFTMLLHTAIEEKWCGNWFTRTCTRPCARWVHARWTYTSLQEDEEGSEESLGERQGERRQGERRQGERRQGERRQGERRRGERQGERLSVVLEMEEPWDEQSLLVPLLRHNVGEQHNMRIMDSDFPPSTTQTNPPINPPVTLSFLTGDHDYQDSKSPIEF